MSLNVVNLVGRVGRDPEARYFDSGSVVCKFSLAVNRRGRNDEPDWFNIEMWGRDAQVAIDYVRKGSLIGVSGALKIDSWTDRNNNPRTTSVIRASRIDLLGSRRDAEAGNAPRDPDSDLF